MDRKTVHELKDLLRKKGMPVSGRKSELIKRLQLSRSCARSRSRSQRHKSRSRSRRRRSMSRKGNVPDNVLDPDLYLKTKEKVKKKVKTWPSAYASSLLVQEYKKAGGRYRGGSRSRSRSHSPLRRWHEEKWVDVSRPKPGGGYYPCGRKTQEMTTSEYKKKYPYCRPSKRVTKDTPTTVGELKAKYGNSKLKQLVKKKRKEALPEKGRSRRISPKATRRK